MLTRTFCHIPGVGLGLERKLWSRGIHTWHDALAAAGPLRRDAAVRDGARQSLLAFQRRDARYFAAGLPGAETWRLFPDFRESCAYFDIETTGLGSPDDSVTTIALYDGRTVRHYVQGRNLEQFETDAAAYDLLVSYNGKSFDVPFLRRSLSVRLHQAHIDLRWVLGSLGYRGGLKGIERQVGLSRPDMEDIDGFFAVILWREYQRSRDPDVLETLLAYNVQDVINLEPLMVLAFDRKVQATPFGATLGLPAPAPAANPFRAHRAVVNRLRGVRVW